MAERPALRRVWVVSGRDRALVADAAVPALRDQLASALVVQVAVPRGLRLRLRVVMRTRARRAGLLHVPAALGVRGYESSVWCHVIIVAPHPDEHLFVTNGGLDPRAAKGLLVAKAGTSPARDETHARDELHQPDPSDELLSHLPAEAAAGVIEWSL